MSGPLTYATDGFVEEVVWQVPARVRERVIQGALVGYAKAATQRRLAVAKYIPGESDARSKVVVVTSSQTI